MSMRRENRTNRIAAVWLTWAAAISSLALPSTARAEPPGDSAAQNQEVDLDRPLPRPPAEPTREAQAAASALFEAGRAAARKGEWAQAYKSFRGSFEQDGSAEALGNMAVAEAKLGAPRLAAEHLDYMLQHMPSRYKEMAPALKGHLAELKKAIGTANIRVETEGAVSLDGKWLSGGPYTNTLYVDPGPHVFRLESNGTRVERTIQFDKGDEHDVVIIKQDVETQVAADKAAVQAANEKAEAAAKAEAARAAAAAAPPPPAPSLKTGVTIGAGLSVALAGVGVAGLGVAALASNERQKIEADIQSKQGYCPTPPNPRTKDACHARDQEAGNEAIGQWLAGAGLGAAAAAGLGTLLYVVIPRGEVPKAQATSTVRLQVVPALGGVWLRGEF